MWWSGFNAPGYGYDQIFDFNRAESDKLDMRGSGANTIDVYGVVNLAASDSIFS